MIRAYTSKDKEELVALLRLNTPQYFDESEEADFIEYLDNRLEDYFVVEDNREIIGSGGINYFPESKLACISWDMVHPNFQGRGVGKQLTLHRIEHIKKNPAINLIVVRTTQLVYKFYEKMGFDLEKTEKDFWAKGFDLYQMQMTLEK
ncbi:N-acetyltransferase [Pontibacter diazotrophicus]|uniref:N-acetyltransferase n=1 Tax=Pontibacter diazotrophicus TaxID=1400979 RepID=A0A3D8L939_9BACT|nr:GNAT family N-acetyltransferase [Pontibacter diazotrophicus]RDV13836.1 N-acetyltransferase [Pontibacter diazotrophicus]